MKHFEVLQELPCVDVYPHLEDMIAQHLLTWQYMDQICINAPQGQDSPYAGVGSLDLDWANAKNTPDGLDVPPRTVALNEHDFVNLCSVFQGTVFETLYTALTDKYRVGRVRLMKTTPRYAMSWHYDYNHRLHYPIKTQFGCFMVIEDEILHLEKNTWYWTATSKNYHTAFNGSNEERIHMVACLL